MNVFSLAVLLRITDRQERRLRYYLKMLHMFTDATFSSYHPHFYHAIAVFFYRLPETVRLV